MNSELEMLKGRVAALEAAMQQPLNADEKIDRIFDIIFQHAGLVKTSTSGHMLTIGDAQLKVAIRKALNLFYSGPTNGLQSKINGLEADVRTLILERNRFKDKYEALKDGLYDLWREESNEDEDEADIGHALRRQEE